MLQSNNTLLNGIAYLGAGFKLIFKPGLKRFVFIPLMINILLFSGLFFLSQHYTQAFNHWMDGYLPAWLHWLNILVWLLFMAGYFLVMIYTFVTLSNIVCLPFNSLLAEKVQLHLTGKSPIQKSAWEFIQELPRLFARQFALIGYFLPRAFFLLILFFVPLVQVIAGVLWFLFSAWMMTIQHLDYPMDNNQVSFQELRRQLSSKRWIALGFGSSILILSVIPIVNFFVIPAAVAGATQFWVKEYSN